MLLQGVLPYRILYLHPPLPLVPLVVGSVDSKVILSLIARTQAQVKQAHTPSCSRQGYISISTEEYRLRNISLLVNASFRDNLLCMETDVDQTRSHQCCMTTAAVYPVPAGLPRCQHDCNPRLQATKCSSGSSCTKRSSAQMGPR